MTPGALSPGERFSKVYGGALGLIVGDAFGNGVRERTAGDIVNRWPELTYYVPTRDSTPRDPAHPGNTTDEMVRTIQAIGLRESLSEDDMVRQLRRSFQDPHRGSTAVAKELSTG